jgi:hypothetical protein
MNEVSLVRTLRTLPYRSIFSAKTYLFLTSKRRTLLVLYVNPLAWFFVPDVNRLDDIRIRI